MYFFSLHSVTHSRCSGFFWPITHDFAHNFFLFNQNVIFGKFFVFLSNILFVCLSVISFELYVQEVVTHFIWWLTIITTSLTHIIFPHKWNNSLLLIVSVSSVCCCYIFVFKIPKKRLSSSKNCTYVTYLLTYTNFSILKLY